ncbi:MAG: cyclic nucleotide-binding domain-containing protein [Anaerolineae bacterium]|nr:cyclic nucleotide-binding domain-containing protein [Anaerolineae bacterium]
MADTPDTIKILSRTPLFQALKQRQLERLSARFAEREYQADDAIVTQGKGGAGFFIIVSGKAEAVRVRADGSKTVLNPLGPTDFFGEMALLTDSVRTASVVATEPTRCLVLTRWDFLAMLREDSEMAVTILQELAERFSRVMDMMS